MQLLVRGEIVALPLKGVIDLAAEKARLEKELAKADADIARVDAKLGNPDFVARAPEEVVEGEREKREEAVARRGENHRGAGAAAAGGVRGDIPSTTSVSATLDRIPMRSEWEEERRRMGQIAPARLAILLIPSRAGAAVRVH